MAVTRESLVGVLLGTAVGDSVGLPYEGLSPRRARRLLGEDIRQRLVLGRGMVSDDTEHTCITAQALVQAGNDVEVFTRRLARGLRFWLLGAPAGAGLATLRATCKLCVGIPPARSGVFSAGNGPAMRAAILGAAVDDRDLLKQFVRASTRITHTDPKAEQGALAVAIAARMAARRQIVAPDAYLAELQAAMNPGEGSELLDLIESASRSVSRGATTGEFAVSLGLARGVSGYMFHTVPIAIHAWLSRQHDFQGAVTDVIRCGGDTDTTAALVGGIIGAGLGKSKIPAEWLTRLWEWPRTNDWMEWLAEQLYRVRTKNQPETPLRLPIYGVLPRNAAFAAIVLAHGFRRLLPPY